MTPLEKAIELTERVQVEQLSFVCYKKDVAKKGAKLIAQEMCTVLAFLDKDAYLYWGEVYLAIDEL